MIWDRISAFFMAFIAPRKGGRREGGKAFTGAAVVAASVAFVGPWEGLRTTAYLDIVGVPTVCYGETQGVQLGQSYTKEECDAMFSDRLREFGAGLSKLIDDDIESTIPVRAKVAYLSWSYNVGLGAASRSTLIRKVNAGDLVGACNELPRWNKAGGQAVRGLTNRRSAEREMCLEAVGGV